ncbi:MarR family transcriptional regulator [Actinomycetes bacterium KLBMP 9759]
MKTRTDPVDAIIAAWTAELPEVLGPESELVKRVLLLSGALGGATAAQLPRFGLTSAEFEVLVALRRSGAPYALKANEISRALLLSSGGTSNVVNRLVARRLAERRPDPDDGRGTRVALTPEGVELAERAVRATTRAHSEVLRGVPPEAISAAADALRAVFAALPER